MNSDGLVTWAYYALVVILIALSALTMVLYSEQEPSLPTAPAPAQVEGEMIWHCILDDTVMTCDAVPDPTAARD